MVRLAAAVYGEPVPLPRPDETSASRHRGSALVARCLGAAWGAVQALWSPRAWRAVTHALVGLPLAALAAAVFVVVPGSLAVSLFDELLPPGSTHWLDTSFYVLAVVTSPIWLRWGIQLLSMAQRGRFENVLRVPLRNPPSPAGFWAFWRAGSTWRQVGYHLLSLVVIPLGVLLVAGGWVGSVALAVIGRTPLWGVLAACILLMAPALSRDTAAIDEFLARRLLGPSRGEELARRVESLARSRSEVVEAADAERRRIERDLHDGAQQRLVSLAMNLGMARATLTDLPEPARQAIADAHDEAKQALVELRQLVRGLHPAVLNDRGLDAALSGLAARAPVPVRLDVDLQTRCTPTIEAVAYFVVSEALTNVAKHAAASEAEVSVVRAGERLRIVITDDGCGGAPAQPAVGSGLRGLIQRAAAVDGTLTIQSPVGGPTRLTVELPCES